MEKNQIGNAIVGQSGGPTAAINATLAGVIRGAREAGVTLYGMRNGIDGLLREDTVNLTEIFADDATVETLVHTPGAALGSCRRKLPRPGEDDAVYEKLLAIFKRLNIRYFFYIGGNDSMDTVAKLSAYVKKVDYPLTVLGVPKTIDNDLVGTDHTPGFGSAAKYIAVTVQEIMRDCAVYAIPAVTIVEIMGRDAGWLTAAAALGRVTGGSAPDLVYLPERDFSMKEFFEDLRAALADHPSVVVAVSEGIHDADGHLIGAGAQSGVCDVFGHAYLSGTGKALELAVKAQIGCKVRSVELNISQRCAGHLASVCDLSESVALGRAAMAAALSGVTREMMVLHRLSDTPYTYEIGHCDISQIANKTRYVDSAYINERGNNVTDDCLRYLLPLIAGEAMPVYENGLPKFFVLDK